MKLLLSSLASQTLDFVVPLLSGEPTSLKVAFISTAADPYGDIRKLPWVTDDRDKLIRMGFTVIDYDIKGKNIKTLKEDLSNFHIIFVAGGNSFYLLNEMKKSGFHILIKELLDKGIVYVGSSAGSAVMGPDLNYLIKIDRPEQVPELLDYAALGLVNERIIPHYGREKYRAIHDELNKTWENKILPLSDEQALRVNGDNIEVVTK